jgi:tetratricopeptide (TPR) repeat protein
MYRGEYRKAYETFALDLDSPFGNGWMGMMLYLLGDEAQAVEHLDRAAAIEPEGFLGLRHGGVSAFIQGRTEEGLRSLRRLEQVNPPDSDGEPWYLIAAAYGLLGDRDGCIRTLRKAVEGGFINYPCMLHDPQLDSARSEDEFQRVLALAKAKHEAFKRRWLGAPGRTTAASDTIALE